MSTAVLKDAALQEYYDSLFSMYGTPGWAKLMEDYAVMAQTHNSLEGIETAENLWARKGQLSMIQHLLSHQTVAEHAFNSLIAEQEGTEPEASTGGTAKVVA